MTQINVLSNDELKILLQHDAIKATETYNTPPIVISIDDSPIATLGNFSASTGKAKAKKTFNVSAIVASALSNQTVLKYKAQLPKEKARILYIDTEQSRYHCHNVLIRILKLAGIPTNQDSANLDFFSLREHPAHIRVQVIDYLLQQRQDYGLVVIDGLRDLLVDFNSISESLDLINKLMEWSGHYNLHIHVIIHLNKSDDNVRGHIGTELNNKAETVLVITKCGINGQKSEVRTVHIRDKEFSPFYFTINQSGLPELTTAHDLEGTNDSGKNNSFKNLSIEQHKTALAEAFNTEEIVGYSNILAALTRGYSCIGYNRKRTAISKLLLYLQEDLELIQRHDKTYTLSHSSTLNDKNR
jgi:hypothetical protein